MSHYEDSGAAASDRGDLRFSERPESDGGNCRRFYKQNKAFAQWMRALAAIKNIAF
jgi:hypothetical protein